MEAQKDCGRSEKSKLTALNQRNSSLWTVYLGKILNYQILWTLPIVASTRDRFQSESVPDRPRFQGSLLVDPKSTLVAPLPYSVDPWSSQYLGAKLQFAFGIEFLWSTDFFVKVNDFIIFENFEIF